MASLIARCGRFKVGATVHVELVGVGTAWTPGTPGSPTFTATGATITGQVVASATAASLVLAITANTVVITDPTNSTTATLRSTGPAVRWFPGLRR